VSLQQARALFSPFLYFRVVWTVLVLELIFQVLIRPPDYHAILHTEKAFLPSTARHISSFHLVYEAIALILFLPQVICMISGMCLDCPFNSPARAPLMALTSGSRFEAALGRLVLSLTFLRAFGLIRHWKQMWIRSAFETKTKDEGPFMAQYGCRFSRRSRKVSYVDCSLVAILNRFSASEGGKKMYVCETFVKVIQLLILLCLRMILPCHKKR
jgi:hypothetical protein